MEIAIAAGQGRPATNEFAEGWRVLVASLLGIGCGLAAIPFYTVGVFAPYLADEFGWSFGQIMAGLTITTVVVIVAAPAAGVLCDKYGTRRVAISSLVMFGLAYISLATLSDSLIRFYVTWAIVATLGAGTLPITFTRTVNQWFDRHRGVALGVAMTGTGVFGVLCKPLLAWVIGSYGWRAGYVALGLLPLALALPAVLLLFREPDSTSSHQCPNTSERLTGMTKGEALRQWRFWLIAVVLLPISFSLAGAVPNLEPILLDRGIDQATILTLTPLVGLTAIAGRIVGGWLLDKFWAPAVAFVLLGAPAISCVILAGAQLDPGMARFAILLLGFALGIEYDVVAYLTSRYFGMKSYSAIYSIFYVCFATGAGFGPLIFGLIRDWSQDFAPALLSAAAALPICAGAFLFLGRYPHLK